MWDVKIYLFKELQSQKTFLGIQIVVLFVRKTFAQTPIKCKILIVNAFSQLFRSQFEGSFLCSPLGFNLFLTCQSFLIPLLFSRIQTGSWQGGSARSSPFPIVPRILKLKVRLESKVSYCTGSPQYPSRLVPIGIERISKMTYVKVTRFGTNLISFTNSLIYDDFVTYFEIWEAIMAVNLKRLISMWRM